MTRQRSTLAAWPLSRRQLLSNAALATAGLTSISVLSPAWLVASSTAPVGARPAADFDADVPTAWFDLMLRLIRETPGYTPPVASRAIGCVGVGLYEAVVPGMRGYRSLAGLVNDLPKVPAAGQNVAYHWPSVANATLAAMMRSLFSSASPALRAQIDSLESSLAVGVPSGLANRSIDRGRAVAQAVDDWSRSDGGHGGHLRNFPTDYVPPPGDGLWEPTPPGNLRAMQPYWGSNRPMVGSARGCDPGPPPPFSTDKASALYAEAFEVYETVNELTAEQLEIAQFWADDPVRTATPPGHSVSILTQVVRSEDRSLADAAEAYAKLGIAQCDAFIACWRVKFEYNLLRPITYIRDHIDPTWGNPLPVTTPPFPEYTSGHSVQSGATAEVLTALFGAKAFTDHTHDALGLPARSFTSFAAAAEEAALSRLYGGIHYRSAIELGLVQGRCIGAAVAGLPLRV